MTRAEFLAWAEQQPSGRFERIDGIVVAMAPERASHNRCKGDARMPDDQVATQVFMSGEISLDPPGIMVTVEVFYAD